MIITPYASFTRPANTTAYASGDLVANSATAGNVEPLRFGVQKMGRANGVIGFARLLKSDPTVTNANFNLHLFATSPTVTNGDNGAFAVSNAESFLGTINFDLTSEAFVTATDVIKRCPFTHTVGGTVFPGLLAFDLDLMADGGRIIYGLLAAAAAYTPASAEQFKIWLEIGSGDNS